MINVIPAIIPDTINDISSQVARVVPLAKTIQIDITDGVFVKHPSWPYNGKDDIAFQHIMDERIGLPYWDSVDYELDLMVVDAYLHMDTWIALGARGLVFHLAAISDTDAFIEFIEGMDRFTRDSFTIGLAVPSDAHPDTVRRFVPFVDFVQIMGIKTIGKQGELLDQTIFQTLKSFREVFPHTTLGVDGGVTLENALSLIAAGADRLVSGSAVWKSPDARVTLSAFLNLA